MKKLFFGILFFICVLPFGVVLANSAYEPGGLSFQAYYDVFMGTPRYLFRFWKSLGICVVIAMGQVMIAALAGYGFGKFQFPCKRLMLFFLMILMVLPLQVTLVPGHVVLNKMELLQTQWALILPSIFLPLGTILMTQSFGALSDEMLQAAVLDGCSTMQSLIRVGVPNVRGSLVCVGILSFLDSWNMVEQPIAYLKDFEKYPLSVALAYVSPGEPKQQFVSCILVLLPPLILFTLFNKDLVEGITFGEEK